MSLITDGHQDKRACLNNSNINSDENSIFNCLPKDMLLEIFRLFSIKELGQLSLVCRQWRVVAEVFLLNPKHAIPSSCLKKDINVKVWETYVDMKGLGLDCQDRSCFQSLGNLKVSDLKIKDDAGFTTLIIPKGLTLNKLKMIANSPKAGNPTDLRMDEGILKELGDKAVGRTYTVLISNSVYDQDILPDSCKKQAYAHRELLRKDAFDFSGVLAVSALAILTYISSSTHLFTMRNRCLEHTHGGARSVVAQYVNNIFTITSELGFNDYSIMHRFKVRKSN